MHKKEIKIVFLAIVPNLKRFKNSFFNRLFFKYKVAI